MRCPQCDGWGRPPGGGRCSCDGTGTIGARTVYRIEAHAGARRLDAYVIPPSTPSSAPPSLLARYARLAPGWRRPVRIHVMPDGWAWIDPNGSRVSRRLG